mgnify:CR=1 FL=1
MGLGLMDRARMDRVAVEVSPLRFPSGIRLVASGTGVATTGVVAVEVTWRAAAGKPLSVLALFVANSNSLGISAQERPLQERSVQVRPVQEFCQRINEEPPAGGWMLRTVATDKYAWPEKSPSQPHVSNNATQHQALLVLWLIHLVPACGQHLNQMSEP